MIQHLPQRNRAHAGLKAGIIEAPRYFTVFCLGFFEASRSTFLRRAARFLILSLPRLCPIRFQNFTA